jgi:hypothetical protein
MTDKPVSRKDAKGAKERKDFHFAFLRDFARAVLIFSQLQTNVCGTRQAGPENQVPAASSLLPTL